MQAGDTLSTIAQRRLGQSARWKELAELNALKEPYTLKVGQVLEIPTGKSSASAPAPACADEPDASHALVKNFFLPLFAWMAIPISLCIGFLFLLGLISSVLFAIGYKSACRVFKIKTTFGTCFLASLCLAVVSCAVNFLPELFALNYPYGILYICLGTGYLIFAISVFMYFFRCDWKRSAGIYLLGGLYGFLWHTVAFILFAIIPALGYLLTHK